MNIQVSDYHNDTGVGALCAAIRKRSDEIPPLNRLNQLAGMIEFCEHLAAVELDVPGVPGILYGFLHHERKRLKEALNSQEEPSKFMKEFAIILRTAPAEDQKILLEVLAKVMKDKELQS